jgi:hypothetical protein
MEVIEMVKGLVNDLLVEDTAGRMTKGRLRRGNREGPVHT